MLTHCFDDNSIMLHGVPSTLVHYFREKKLSNMSIDRIFPIKVNLPKFERFISD